MFATIIFGSLIMIIIIALILEISSDGEYFLALIIPLALCVGCLMASLFCGVSITKQKDLINKKQYIEYCLENSPSYYIIEEASKYNKNVNWGNNLWCRFTIENRNEYIIDIDKYIGDNK